MAAATASGQVGFGDSAETVAGVESTGVLHAPGYNLYVLAVKSFAVVVPLGDLALEVNSFSVVCSAVTAVLLYVACRAVGAGQVGSLVGCAVYAAGLSTWFYAAYAKSYAFTALLLVGMLVATLAWRARGRMRWLLVAAALAGLSLGASYQVVAASLPGFAVLAVSTRRPSARALLGVLATGLAAAAAVTLALLWRAGSDPAVNWGQADSAGRLLDLLLMRDFLATSSPADGTGQESQGGGVILGLANAGLLLGREFGPLAVVAAGAGAVRLWALRRATPAAGLALLWLGNVVAVAVLYSGEEGLDPGSDTLLRTGGFLLTAKLVTAVLVAVGTTWTLERLHRPRGTSRPATPSAARTGLAAVLVVATVLVPVVWNARTADHRTTPYAAHYVADVFDALPQDALLLMWGVEQAFVLEQEQIVHGTRPDVTIHRIPLLARQWYRDQQDLRGAVSEEERPYSAEFAEAVRIAEVARQDGRAVYVDLGAAQAAGDRLDPLGLRVKGLVALASGTPGPPRLDLPATTTQSLTWRNRPEVLESSAQRFPNGRSLRPYVIAHFELGRALAEAGRPDLALNAYARALAFDPDFTPASRAAREAAPAARSAP